MGLIYLSMYLSVYVCIDLFVSLFIVSILHASMLLKIQFEPTAKHLCPFILQRKKMKVKRLSKVDLLDVHTQPHKLSMY